MNAKGTIGVDFKIRPVELDGKIIKLHIWDTSSQERFKALRSCFYRGALIIIAVVYDVTNQRSYDNVSPWLQEVKRYAPAKVKIALAGNKCDLASERVVLASERVVDFATAQLYADSQGIPFFELSPDTDANIKEILNIIREDIQNRMDPALEPGSASPQLGPSTPVSMEEENAVSFMTRTWQWMKTLTCC